MTRYISLNEFHEAYMDALHLIFSSGFADTNEPAFYNYAGNVNLYAYKRAAENYSAFQERMPFTQRRRYNRSR